MLNLASERQHPPPGAAEMDEVIRGRTQLNGRGHFFAITVNDIIISCWPSHPLKLSAAPQTPIRGASFTGRPDEQRPAPGCGRLFPERDGPCGSPVRARLLAQSWLHCGTECCVIPPAPQCHAKYFRGNIGNLGSKLGKKVQNRKSGL